MAVQQSRRIALSAIALAAMVPLIGACSSDLSLNDVTRSSKPDSLMRKPDWATFSGGKNDFELRAITAADLVGPEGQCAGGAGARFRRPGRSGGRAAAAAGGRRHRTADDRMRCRSARRSG